MTQADIPYDEYLRRVRKQKDRDYDRFTGADSHADDDAYDASTGAAVHVADASQMKSFTSWTPSLINRSGVFMSFDPTPEPVYGPEPLNDPYGRRILAGVPRKSGDSWQWVEFVDGAPIEFSEDSDGSVMMHIVGTSWYDSKHVGGGWWRVLEGTWLPGSKRRRVQSAARRVARKHSRTEAPPKGYFS